MMYRKSITILIPSELLHTIDSNTEHILVARCSDDAIVLRPIITQPLTFFNTFSKEYQKGYLMGLSDGYHKGYCDSMAFESMCLKHQDDVNCAGLRNTCPYYDDLLNSCKLYA